MKDEELVLARKKYSELMHEREETIKQDEIKLKQIQKNDIVKEYQKLSYNISDEGRKASKDSVLERSFGAIAQNTEQNNNVFVFIGYYGTSNISSLAPLSEKNPYSRYLYFANLETTDVVAVEKSNYSKFASENVTLFIDDPKNYHHIGFYREKFNELRNKYFSYLVESTEKEAIKQIIIKR